MQVFNLRLSTPVMEFRVSETPFRLWNVVECRYSLLGSMQISCQTCYRHPSVGFSESRHGVNVSIKENAETFNSYRPRFSLKSVEQAYDDNARGLDDILDIKDEKCEEKERDIFIGKGRAGGQRIPWNKGKKHSAETREKIKQRTREALSDPKVRMKMSETSFPHNSQSKQKMSLSLKKVWGRRLNYPRQRERFFLSWAKRIAEAAKKGGIGQQELDWDSFDKIKQILTLKQAAEEASAEEMAKFRARRDAKAKADKLALAAQRKREQKEKLTVAGETKRVVRRKSSEAKERLAVAEELKLKAKLTKIQKKMSSNIRIKEERSHSQKFDWEKLDLELIRREKLQEVSLADQIRAAKEKRATKKGTLEVLSSFSMGL